MSQPAGSTRFPVREDSERLDLFLADASALSRRRIRALIAGGQVCVNLNPTRRMSKPLRTGDIVDLLLPASEIPQPPTLPGSIDIIHEDRDLLAVNKPAGLLSQPIREKGRREDAMDQLALIFLSYREGRRVYLRMIHRLDRQTSGLMIFSRNPSSLPQLDAAWKAGKVRRMYLALLSGSPSWGDLFIDEPIARDPAGTWRFHCHPKGKQARSRFHVLSKAPRQTLVLCELETGRTHQVRVHAAASGFPVVGDRLYGGRKNADGLLLHAWGISLPHPRSRSLLELSAPPPGRFAAHLPPNFPSEPWKLECIHA